MRKVLICLNPFISHFIPTKEFANALEENGYVVTYVGFKNLEGIVTKEGYNFISLVSCTNDEIVFYQKQRANRILESIYIKVHKELSDIYEKFNPDIVFIGISRLAIYAIPALEKNIKIILYSLCAGSPSFSSKIPPVTSDYVITGKVYDRILCTLQWIARFWRKGINPNVICSKRFYPWVELKHICRQKQIPWKFGIDGYYPDFPLIVLGPKLFEFRKSEEVYYTGLGIGTRCNSENPVSDEAIYNMKKKRPIIYCSFGTMCSRYQNVEIFMKALIDLLGRKKQWQLILSLGEKGATSPFEHVADNIIIKDFVSQTEILNIADVFITHAGFSSVKESIYFGVPMLAFPCSYDQKGNAARIEFHQIGIKNSVLKRRFGLCNYKKSTKPILEENLIDALERGINMLLQERKYKENILTLRRNIIHSDEMLDAIQMIDNIK